MKRLTATLPLSGLLLAGLLASVSLRAQQAQEENGPGRGVARLSLINGDVSVKRGDSGDWVAGAVNAPLLAEDRIATGPMARAEIQFDYFHRLRVAPDGDVRLAGLEHRRYTLQLARGTVTFAALQGGDAQVEISTPGAAVRPVAHGSYRVTVLPDGDAEITVRSGEAEIFTPRGSQRLRPDRTMMVRAGAGAGPEFMHVTGIDRDAWDDFNEARDRELRRGEQIYSRYVPRDIFGAEDLVGHGQWIHVAPFGHVWQPFVGAGWAPYTLGRWTWLDWYGWSWISHDPWGWAPHHFGRWFMHAGNWCWFPGAFGARHWWRPALVGWIGFGGPNWGLGLGFGHIGWVPLAPFDPLFPWWGGGIYGGFLGGNFIQNNVHIVNNTNVMDVYRNARFNNAVSMADGADFTRGDYGRYGRAAAGDLRNAHLVRGAVPVAPGRDSLRYSNADSRAHGRLGPGSGQERFYSRTEVPRVERVPFDQQRRAFTSAGEGSRAGYTGGRGAEAYGAGAGGVREGAVTSGGWRGFGDPRASAPQGDPSNPGARSNAGGLGYSRGGERTNVLPGRGEYSGGSGLTGDGRSGWRRFGDPAQGARTEAPRTETSGSNWSAFGNRERVAAPYTPRNEGSRSGATERGTWSTGGGWDRLAAPGTSGFEDSRAGYSGRGDFRTERPYSSGGAFGGARGAGSESAGGSAWSTGGMGGGWRSTMPQSGEGGSSRSGYGGRSAPSGGNYGGYGIGGGGMRSAPSGGGNYGGGYGFGGMRSAPSGGNYGGGYGIGGGGNYGGGSMRAPGGSGMRYSGGGGSRAGGRE